MQDPFINFQVRLRSSGRDRFNELFESSSCNSKAELLLKMIENYEYVQNLLGYAEEHMRVKHKTLSELIGETWVYRGRGECACPSEEIVSEIGYGIGYSTFQEVVHLVFEHENTIADLKEKLREQKEG